MSIVLGLTYGPPAPRLDPDLAVRDVPYGPCESGLATGCAGYGEERMSPGFMLAPSGEFLDLETPVPVRIVCGLCARLEKTWRR